MDNGDRIIMMLQEGKERRGESGAEEGVGAEGAKRTNGIPWCE